MDRWKCNKCEHINNIKNYYCDICDSKAPKISSYSFSEVDAKNQFTFLYEVEDCELISIKYGSKSFDFANSVGEVSFLYKRGLDVILVLSNEITSVNCEIKVEIESPIIRFFNVDRNFLENSRNKKVLLSWECNIGYSIEIEGGAKNLEKKGSLEHEIEESSEIRLNVSNVLGETVSEYVNIEVSKDPPKIKEFSLSKSILTDSTPSQLAWKIEGAEKVNINVVGENTVPVGLKEIHVLENTEILLEAWSYFGVKVEKKLQLSISNEPPVIKEFKPEFEYTFPNHEIYINWEIESSENTIITDSNNSELYNGDDLKGQLKVKITDQTVFKLITTNIFGQKSYDEFIVKLLPIPSIDRFVFDVPEIRSEIKIDKISLDGVNDIQLNDNFVNLKLDNIDLSGYVNDSKVVNEIKLDDKLLQVKELDFVEFKTDNLIKKLAKKIRNGIRK